jgi:hypothetical protein
VPPRDSAIGSSRLDESFVLPDHQLKPTRATWRTHRNALSTGITTFKKDREIAWTIEYPLIDPPMGYVYGYVLEPVETGTAVTSYYDWSNVHEAHRTRINFPVIPEASLRATLGILARTLTRANSSIDVPKNH